MEQPRAGSGRHRAPAAGAGRLGPRVVVAANPALPDRIRRPTTAAVLGGGVAGVVAATVLAERGVQVTLLEAGDRLGGRVAAWPVQLPDGETHMVEHGFHGFFRHYYNWRAFLRRLDPDLSFLQPLDDYPVVSAQWPAESLGRLPRLPLANLAVMFARSPSLRLRDLRQVDLLAATRLLAYDRTDALSSYSQMSAAELLDSLRFTDRARSMLFEVFAHSFFNDEKSMSAAELLLMFHCYFLGNPEGLRLDTNAVDTHTCLWSPLHRRLESLGADVRLGTPARSLAPGGDSWRVATIAGDVVADHVVLALDVPGLQHVVGASEALSASRLAAQVDGLATAPPYVVVRWWFDRDRLSGRPAFAAVAGGAGIDLVTQVHRLQEDARGWAQRTGGAVVEVHAAGLDESAADPAVLEPRLRRDLERLWPELAGADVRHVHVRVGRDAPAFPVGRDADRPTVRTDLDGVTVAGDEVALDFPTGLMERAASSGMLAANAVLAAAGAAPEPVLTVPRRGVLAGVPGLSGGGGAPRADGQAAGAHAAADRLTRRARRLGRGR